MRTRLSLELLIATVLACYALGAANATAAAAGGTSIQLEDNLVPPPDTNAPAGQIELWPQGSVGSAQERSIWEIVNDEYNQRRKNRAYGYRDEIVLFGSNCTLQSNELARTVVVFGGNVKIDGLVRGDVVCFGGNVIINGIVGKNVVAFGGNVDLGDGAKVGQDIVPFGGDVRRSPSSEVGGRVTFPAPFGPWPGGALFKHASDWLLKCLLLGRPLSLSLPWLWLVEGALLLVSLLVAVLFARPVEVCAGRLEDQPVSSFFVGLMTWILFPMLVTLLCIIVVGIIAVPFLAAGFVVALLIGKVALCVFIGRQFGRQLKVALLDQPLVGFLLGWIVITALYVVPVLGGLTFLFVGVWALGAATAATFGGMRRERPPQANGIAASPGIAGAPMASGGASVPVSDAPFATFSPEQAPANPNTGSFANPRPATSNAAGAGTRPPDISSALPPLVEGAPRLESVDPLLLPRAEFGSRVAAAILDLVIVAFVSSYVNVHWFGRPLFPILAVAYFAALIAWKGTTVGGIVLNLKVTRLDGQPIGFAVALVRALAAWLSVAVFGLGFLWILWDREKQSWHDKIAGTVVVRVPKAQPLL